MAIEAYRPAVGKFNKDIHTLITRIFTGYGMETFHTEVELHIEELAMRLHKELSKVDKEKEK